MAISFIAGANGGTGSSTSFSVTLPATQADDILILEFTHRGTGDGTIGGTSVTTGGLTWTLKHSQLYASSTFTGKTYWTRCTGNHTGQTVTGSSLTNSCAAIVTQYRGCIATGDPITAATIVGEQNAAGNETQAEISTTIANAWVVLVVVNSPDLAVATQACTSPGTLTERQEVLSTAGTDTSIAHASAAKAATGGTGALTWTQTDAASGSWAYALNPNWALPVSTAGAVGITGQTVTLQLPIALAITVAGAITIAGQTFTTDLSAIGSGGDPAPLPHIGLVLGVDANKHLDIDTAGAITVAGQALTFNGNVAVDPGAVTVAGQSATFNRGIALANGAVTIAGQSATANTGLALSTAGAVTIAGQTVIPSLRFDLLPGAITIAGQTASFNSGLAVSTAGAVTVAGQSAAANLGIALANGALTITGQDVTVVPPTNDKAVAISTAGAITVAGQAAAFNSNVALSTAGVVGIAGQTLAIAQNTNFTFDQGAITVAGQTVTPSLRANVDAGAVTVAGQTATFNRGLAISTAGAVSISGQTLTLFYSGNPSSENPAPFPHIGLILQFTQNLGLSVSTPGAISLTGQTITLDLPSTERPAEPAWLLELPSAYFAEQHHPALRWLEWHSNTPNRASLLGDLTLDITVAGALTVTGQTATLAQGIPLVAGAVTITGQTVTTNLQGNLALPINPAGQVSIAGQSAAANVNTALGAGAVTISGQAVDVSPTLQLTAGALTITGQSATFSHGIAIAAGQITLTGQELTTNLANSLVLSLTPATMTVIGQACDIGLNIGLDAGAVSIAGETLTTDLTTQVYIDIDTAGQVRIAGQTAELVLSGTIIDATRIPFDAMYEPAVFEADAEPDVFEAQAEEDTFEA